MRDPSSFQARARRLRNEYAAMRELEKQSTMVSFKAEGEPPSQYEITLHCKGLVRVEGHIRILHDHAFSVILPDRFPKEAPAITWRTPLYHPNFRPPHVCVGDEWFSGLTLSELCIVLIEMVQFKRFNIYDPLDPDVAIWVRDNLEMNPNMFPLEQAEPRNLSFDWLQNKKKP